MISILVQTQHFRESQIQKHQNWSSRCDKFHFQKVYLYKRVFHLLPSVSLLLLEHLNLFLFILTFAVVVSFLFWWSFLAQILSLAVSRCRRYNSRCWTDYKNSKCVIVIDIKECVLLTGNVTPINFIELSTLKYFSQSPWLCLEIGLCKLFSANRTK